MKLEEDPNPRDRHTQLKAKNERKKTQETWDGQPQHWGAKKGKTKKKSQ